MSSANRWPGDGRSPWRWRAGGRGFTWRKIWLSLGHFQQRILDLRACLFQSAFPGVEEQSFVGHNYSRVWSWWKIRRKNTWPGCCHLPRRRCRDEVWKRYFIWVQKLREKITDLQKILKRRGLNGKKNFSIRNISTWNKTICNNFPPILASFPACIWSQAPASNAHMGCCCISLL